MPSRRVTAIATLAAALALAPTAAPTAAGPALRLVDLEPFTVLGLRFDPGATVTVRVWTKGKTWTRRTEVGERGRFTVRFPVAAGRRCGTWLAALATASDGTRAGLKLPTFECRRR